MFFTGSCWVDFGKYKMSKHLKHRSRLFLLPSSVTVASATISHPLQHSKSTRTWRLLFLTISISTSSKIERFIFVRALHSEYYWILEKNGKCRTDGYLLESEEGALVSVHLIIGRKHKVLQSFVARQRHPRDTIVCPTFSQVDCENNSFSAMFAVIWMWVCKRA